MAMVKAAWAANYLRWVGVFGVTAGIHAAAFCLYVEGGGRGHGAAVPEGRVTLHLTQTVSPHTPALASFRMPERPVVTRARPIQLEGERLASDQPIDMPDNMLVAPPSFPQCALSQATATQTAVPNIDASQRTSTPGPVLSELDQPLSLGQGPTPPRIMSGVARPPGDAHAGTLKPASADGNRPPTCASKGEDGDADFALGGKPIYPIACRRGDCAGDKPCEGVSRWRITVLTPNSTPSCVEQIVSAGCARLDASVASFLRDARIPRAGVFYLRFRFKLEGR